MTARTDRIPILLAPLAWLWGFVSFILGLTGRLVVVVLGFALLVAGILLTLTVLGAIVGIPLLIVGFALVLRGLF